ncbi:hypothetical protein CPJCM30710_17160 [Clostridium polyendosporum]|uniref:Cytochrome b5 heme-binding domain-containing protein n=1 Tax=Clostridium polyendosporum TaxID=69208 RepID=A0A919S0S3_9CLOT|nr:cytochrome b5 domain-containing protein [Clostridium polyendosporum]GIM29050.1 hypothetical protein CPJCM30710_17160 [Clostridium polyendosporum]
MCKLKEELLAEKYCQINYLKGMLWISHKSKNFDYILRMLKKVLLQVEMIKNLPGNDKVIIKKSDDERVESDRREFTLEELAKFDGKGDNPAYVAINGTVYDVTDQKSWGGGTHFGLYAGKDLSDAYNSCHTNSPALSKLKVVGVLKQ